MGRKILFITTDQQRYDALGCNGNEIARTPVVDRLAANGINYQRAYNQNTVCMPARSTMLTGQYVRTHGVFANGVQLPHDAPSVAAHLSEHAGYRTALLGKAHFDPGFDPMFTFPENAMAGEGSTGPLRGFKHAELAMHAPTIAGRPFQHYGKWLVEEHPDDVNGFAALLQAEGGGDTGAPETKINPIPRDLYHTDWVADRTIAFLDSLDDGDDWFVWMSFPDPHHPWDPPASERKRVPWEHLDLPPGHPGSPDAIRDVLAQKPPHWLGFYEGSWRNVEGGPARFVPATLEDDQLREVNAVTHVMNELIDEACGRVLDAVERRGWTDDTDVFFTTDHGELQGDYGLLFKGPFHTDALMRVPFVWRPAPSARVAPAVAVDAGRAAADGGRLRSRAGVVRVGQSVPRLRDAHALDLPRRVVVHRVRAEHRGRAERPRGVPRSPARADLAATRIGGRRTAQLRRLRRHRRRAVPGRRGPAPVQQPLGGPRVPLRAIGPG